VAVYVSTHANPWVIEMKEVQTRKVGDRVFRTPIIKPWRIAIKIVRRPKYRHFSPLILVYGFVSTIVLGTILLILPISNNTGEFTPFINALFTSTSAVCVTGLIVVDTGTFWSSFGQGVILALIQIGGFGIMTSATIFLLVLGRRIGLRERLLIGQSMGLSRLGGLVRIVKRIALFTILFEVVGAALFYIRFSTESPPGTAVWKSIFQSVSSFNNAGFDIFGNFRSMLDYQGDTLIVLVTAVLVVIGGISYIVVADVFKNRRLTRLSMDTKLVLATTASLLVLGMIVILFTEYSDPGTLGTLPLHQKLLVSFFQSVTPRTAGFTIIDMGSLAHFALIFTMVLMFIGGASGSTAGGIKVNTFGMMVATIWSSLRGREYAGVFGREFKVQQIYRALAVVLISLTFVTIVVFLLAITEEFSFIDLLFETFSAFGTVGLSTGITPDLSTAGRLILTFTMFVGRLGPLALVLYLVHRQQPSTHRYPQEEIRIG
jgi:trk system potassium uptake protein TrkH